MLEVALLIILTVVLVCIFVFLYNQGYMVLKSTSAVTFVGSLKGNSATFTACNGYMKRVIKFKTDGTYTFTLDAELTKGDMSVELLDAAKESVMHLDCESCSASLTAEENKKYYLVIRFKSATGRYTLHRT